MVCVDGVNVLCGSVHAVKKNAKILIVTSKELRLEVSADKLKYIVMSRDKNAGRSHSMKSNKEFL